MTLARKTVKRLITFGKRDFTFVSVSDRRHNRGHGRERGRGRGIDVDIWVSGRYL